MRIIAAALVLLAATALPAAAQPAKKGCDLPNADTSVAGIKLGDSNTTKKALGEDYTHRRRRSEVRFCVVRFLPRATTSSCS